MRRTRAAYRFFSNPNRDEVEIMAGYFRSTRDRFRAKEGPILVLHDTGQIIHIGDRESDIYDFFRAAQDDGSHFVLRLKVNRRTEDETLTIHDAMENVKKR